jgi:predicted acylesterase/phospholipase RssA
LSNSSQIVSTGQTEKLNKASRSKAALVLAGGGVAGAAYEIGALCAIEDALCDLSVNDLEIYVGTSAGAIVNSCLVNGVSPHTLLTLLNKSLLGIEPLGPHHVFSLNPLDLLRRTLILPRELQGIAQRVLCGGALPSFLELMEAFAAALPTSFFDSEGLESYLRDILTQPGKSNDFRQLHAFLAIIATNLDNGERAIFGLNPLAEVPISKAVCASAALPPFYRPVRIGDNTYIDGGLRGSASLDIAIEQGAKLIVCINPMVPFDNTPQAAIQSIGDRGAHWIGNQIFRIVLSSSLHYHLKQIQRQYPDVDILLIEPHSTDALMFGEHTMRYSTRLKIARHGFETVARHLVKHEERFRVLLAKHNIQISTERIAQALELLDRAGTNTQNVQAVLAKA